jgi:hypothetical protein
LRHLADSAAIQKKTVIKQAGLKVLITDEISFKFGDTIHIFGMDINSELTNLDSNFDKTIGSLKKKCELLG